jgi:hypothetical protein
MARATETTYYSGQGIVYLAEKDSNGALLGYRDIGNVPELKLSFETTTIEHKEARSGNRLTDLRLATDKNCTASITLEGFDAETLKTAMFATVTTSASGTVTAEEFTARLGKVSKLAKIGASAVVLKGTGANSAITYVLDKNYTVNGSSIYIMSAAEQTAAAATNSIADGAVLSVAYSYAAQTETKAFKDSQKTYSLMFEGLNTADSNAPVVVTIPNFRPDPLKDLSLISNELQTFVLEGAALADTATGDFVNIQQLS